MITEHNDFQGSKGLDLRHVSKIELNDGKRQILWSALLTLRSDKPQRKRFRVEVVRSGVYEKNIRHFSKLTSAEKYFKNRIKELKRSLTFSPDDV